MDLTIARENCFSSLYYFEYLCAQSDRTLNHYDKASDFLEGDGRFSMRSMGGFNNGDAVRTRYNPRWRLTTLCVEIRRQSCFRLVNSLEWTRLTSTRALYTYNRLATLCPTLFEVKLGSELVLEYEEFRGCIIS